MPSFTVVPKGCRIFRTKLHHVEADFTHMEAGLFDLFFKVNFDNYRTYTSPRMTNSDAKKPFWDDFAMNFNYETEFAHLMVAKRLTISFFAVDPNSKGQSHFLGDAIVDLLTLATGPPDINLAIHQGDMAVGRVKLLCDMEEVSETTVTTKQLTIELPGVDLAECIVSIRTKAAAEYTIDTEKPDPATVGNNLATFTRIAKHHFGATAANFYESAGPHFEVKVDGTIGNQTVARGLLLVSKFMQADAGPAFRPGKVSDSGSGEVLFHDVALNDPESERPIGKVAGLVFFDNLPTYVQMYAGHTVDGIVYDGKSINTGNRPTPPRQAAPGTVKPV